MFSRKNPGRLCELAVVTAAGDEGVPEAEVVPRRRSYAAHLGIVLRGNTQNSDRPAHIKWAISNPKHRPAEQIRLGHAQASLRGGRYFLTWPSSRKTRSATPDDLPTPPKPTTGDTHQDLSDQIVSAVEGIAREQRILAKGRSARLRKEAFRLAHGICAVCEKDFSRVLEGRGIRVLQVHHKEQLALSREPLVTRLEDLAVVCANCHALIHLNTKSALGIEELQGMLRAKKTAL